MATVISVKKHEEAVLELNKQITRLISSSERDAGTIRALQQTVDHRQQLLDETKQYIEDLEVFRNRVVRKYWWQFWKPKWPYK